MIKYFIKHPILANLLMFILISGGILTAYNMKKEVFPRIETDIIKISVSYNGATSYDIEQSIINPIEEKILSLEGIDEIESNRVNGSASIVISLLDNENKYKMLNDIENEVKSVSLPENSETPSVKIIEFQKEVLSVMIYGDNKIWDLHEKAKKVENLLLTSSHISSVETEEIEHKLRIKLDNLDKYGINVANIKNKIIQNELYMTIGSLENKNGETYIVIDNNKKLATDFAKMKIKLGDVLIPLYEIRNIQEEIETSTNRTLYKGKNSVEIEVFRVGKQTPLEIHDEVYRILNEHDIGVNWEVVKDRSLMYKERMNLILKNALFGLILVLIILGVFLDFKLAFWVAIGIPTAFLGTIMVMPLFDISINMVSMFAFIISLGIIIDDAIIVGENVYEYRNKGMGLVEASIQGTKDIAVPIVFAIITNIIAFLPLAFLSGEMGKIFIVIPIVVIISFLISLFEVLFILPNHLANTSKKHTGFISKYIFSLQQNFEKKLEWFIKNIYEVSLIKSLRHKYLTSIMFFLLLSLIIGYGTSGRLGFSFMPQVESDRATLSIDYDTGTNIDYIIKSSSKYGEFIENKYKDIVQGWQLRIRGESASVTMFLVPEDEREISTGEVIKYWEKNSKIQLNMKSINFRSNIGGPGGGRDPLGINIIGDDLNEIKLAAKELENKLYNIDNVKRVNSSLEGTNYNYKLELNELGKSLDINLRDIYSSLRTELYDNNIKQILRNNEEIDISITKENNQNLYDLENYKYNNLYKIKDIRNIIIVKTKNRITHIDGKLIENISADLKNKTILNQTMEYTELILEEIKNKYDVTFEWRGESKDVNDTMSELITFFGVTLFLLWSVLAILFKSYSTPLIIIVAIPFGIIGSILGHIIMGYGLSIVSVLGIIALTGVVINDSIILVNYTNELLQKGMNYNKRIIYAGTRRFRPILLTTITTFVGLLPMIFETSVQAKFLIPMAISLAFGIMFATLITLILIPNLLAILKQK